MKSLIYCIFPLAALAQQMTGPTLGWSLNGRAWQAIQGVPGAARLANLEAGPEDLTQLSVSPGGQRAAALAEGVAVVIDLATRQRTALSRDFAATDFVWSPSGTALLLVNKTTGQVLPYRGAEALAEQAIAADRYAISDDGTSILSLRDGELALHSANGSSVLGHATAFTFLARSQTPAFVDGTDLVLGSRRVTLNLESALLASPAANRLLVVEAGTGKVLWLDEQGATLTEASCQAPVDRIEALGSPGILRLVTSGGGPAWFTETTASATRLFFVPQPDVATEAQ